MRDAFGRAAEPYTPTLMTEIRRASPIIETPRVVQLRGMFDIPRSDASEVTWTPNIDLADQAWNIGLIVGHSGCGKSTLARELFGQSLVSGYDWPADQSLIDGFPVEMPVAEITGLLSSVGFSSPPAWLRPFHVLSNGEQFRVTLARAICDPREVICVDEFTSVVDRTVAQIGSAAVARTIRQRGRKLVAVACHYDIIDWLDPDWIYQPHSGVMTWRLERQPRPHVDIDLQRVSALDAWNLFRPHHYLTGSILKNAIAFVAMIAGRPAAFAAARYEIAAKSFCEHRLVCLPDFQGIGIGNRVSEFVAGVMAATGTAYQSVTTHPALIRSRAKSHCWDMFRKPGRRSIGGREKARADRLPERMLRLAFTRETASFRYTGPAHTDAARSLGVIT